MFYFHFVCFYYSCLTYSDALTDSEVGYFDFISGVKQSFGKIYLWTFLLALIW